MFCLAFRRLSLVHCIKNRIDVLSHNVHRFFFSSWYVAYCIQQHMGMLRPLILVIFPHILTVQSHLSTFGPHLTTNQSEKSELETIKKWFESLNHSFFLNPYGLPAGAFPCARPPPSLRCHVDFLQLWSQQKLQQKISFLCFYWQNQKLNKPHSIVRLVQQNPT